MVPESGATQHEPGRRVIAAFLIARKSVDLITEHKSSTALRIREREDSQSDRREYFQDKGDGDTLLGSGHPN